VIASGEGLPAVSSTNVVSATIDGRSGATWCLGSGAICSGICAAGLDDIGNQSACLRELFLHLVRKEDPCTPGNAGARPVPVSSFS